PIAQTVVSSGNYREVSFSGTCTEEGARVVLTGDVANSPQTHCQNLYWSLLRVEISGADGPKFVTASIIDVVGNTSHANVNIFKNTLLPTAILSDTPAAYDTELAVRVSGAGVT